MSDAKDLPSPWAREFGEKTMQTIEAANMGPAMTHATWCRALDEARAQGRRDVLDEAGDAGIIQKLRDDAEIIRGGGAAADPKAADLLMAAAMDLSRARHLIAALVDPDDCTYDHDDMCQAHGLDASPCPHQRAKVYLARLDGEE